MTSTIILTPGRSGSNHFLSSLHKDHHILGEYFNDWFPTTIEPVDNILRQTNHAAGHFTPSISDRITLLEEYPADYIIKVMPGDTALHPEILDWIATSGWPVLFLERRDLLEWVMSWLIATHTRWFHSQQSRPPTPSAITPTSGNKAFVAAQYHGYQALKKTFNGTTVFYEDIDSSPSDFSRQWDDKRALFQDINNVEQFAKNLPNSSMTTEQIRQVFYAVKEHNERIEWAQNFLSPRFGESS